MTTITRFATGLLAIVLASCGQPGPLYLPTDVPPIYVVPEPQPDEGQAPTTSEKTETEIGNKPEAGQNSAPPVTSNSKPVPKE